MVNDDEGTIESKKVATESQELLVDTKRSKQIWSFCVPFLSCENGSLMVSWNSICIEGYGAFLPLQYVEEGSWVPEEGTDGLKRVLDHLGTFQQDLLLFLFSVKRKEIIQY
jgi:hypothetical protein